MWAEIDLDAVAQNIRALKALAAPGTKLMAVVKAGAYGHGSVEVSRTALKNGADWLAVARTEEGICLRKSGIDAPVLVFGTASKEEIKEALKNQLTLTIYDRESARAISETACSLGVQADVHVKIDTGMGRLGFNWDECAAAVEEVNSFSGLNFTGIYTHFAAADACDKFYTRRQFNNFKNVLEELKERGINFPLRHAANSAALIDFPESHLDMVRPGISVYGCYPSGEVDSSRVELKPAMTLKTRVAQVKEVGPGFHVSYGCTYVTPASTVLAALAAGYADGYNRLLSSKGQVLVHGSRAPVVGRVCMDQCIAGVGHIPAVSPGDEAILMGRQGDEMISADEIAASIGTINYEVLTSVSSRVPRVYI
ncbi:MAG: alanine racemase [Clostridiales bacterium]|nr:alanine racemase [Clostridiales bacterium]MCF8023517.1 alanine racemase [Clostridiales bacterium]